ncbi:hypothetical protein OAN50_03010, partial [Flavobacteriaceae bacterium]|nr:hypothetical protein [Flavobacteriaceae bacterium]
HKNEEKIKKVLEKNKYTSKDSNHSFQIFKPTHLPRMVNKNKEIAIEPHLELLSPKGRYVFNSKKLINDFKDVTKIIKTPNKSFLFDHCIYTLQIDDRRIINSNHSHRSIYDIYKLNSKNSLTINNIKKDIFIKHFFLNIDKFKIFDITLTSTFLSSYFDKLFRFLTISLFTIQNIPKKCLRIIKPLFSNEDRVHVLNKISIHYHHKTLLNYLYTWLKA